MPEEQISGVSVIIPTLNAAGTIEKLIKHILSVMQNASLTAEIIVVDDGSTDGSRRKITDLSKNCAVSLICREQKRGLASAVIEGAAHARHEIVVVMDGDYSHSPEDVPSLAAPVLTGVSDIAIGSRYTRGGTTPGWPLKRRIAWKLASFPAQVMTSIDDPLSGFFAVRKALLLGMKHEIPGYKLCLELLLRQGQNLKVTEIPISTHDRQAGISKMTMVVLKEYLLQLARLCGLTIPANFLSVFMLLLISGLLSDTVVYSLTFSLGAGLLFSQIAGLLGSITVIAIAAQILYPRRIFYPGMTRHLYTLFWGLLLLIFRSGFLVLLPHASWGQTAFSAVPVAALSAMIIALFFMNVFPARAESSPDRLIRFRLGLLLVILVSLALRLVFAGSFELLMEEAYYWNYAQHLAIGYLDHPPMVALLIKGGTMLFGTNEFGVRIGAILCWCLATLFVYLYTRDISNRDTALQAAVIMAVLPAFFAFGLLLTPDAPLIACWAGTLFFARRAMVDMDSKSWLGVGVFLGLGLFSKYTIALLGPAFLLFMLIDRPARKWYLKPQPYAAALLALLIFSPVILWNIEHEWASFLFQTQDRLKSSSEFSSHELLLSIIVLLSPVGFVSALLFLVKRRKFIDVKDRIARRQYAFSFIMVCVPLFIFFVFSLTKEVKFNWTSPLWLAAIPFMATTMSLGANRGNTEGSSGFFKAWKITIVFFLLAYGITLHYFSVGIPGVPYPKKGPLFGWRDYAAQVDVLVEKIGQETGTRPAVVGMDLYKTASGLAFYRTIHFDRANRSGPQRPPVLETAGRNIIFGQGAVMYDYWFTPQQFNGRPLLLVSPDQGDLAQSRIARDIGSIGPIKEFKAKKNNQELSPLYYRYVSAYNAGSGIKH